MPLTGDFAVLRRLSKVLSGLVTPGTPQRAGMNKAAAGAVKALTREQFRTGTGPDGSQNRETKRGGVSLLSQKLARGAVAVVVEGDVIRGYMKNSKWSPKLEAHQEGHTFPAKSGVQRRGRTGRLIGKDAFARRVAGATSQAWVNTSGSYGYAIRTKSGGLGRVRASVQRTKGGARVLPPTPIFPVGGSRLTPHWNDQIGRTVSANIRKTLHAVKR